MEALPYDWMLNRPHESYRDYRLRLLSYRPVITKAAMSIIRKEQAQGQELFKARDYLTAWCMQYGASQHDEKQRVGNIRIIRTTAQGIEDTMASYRRIVERETQIARYQQQAMF